MTHQLDFWPAAEKTPYAQKYWETLSMEDRSEQIARLAKLIAKTVCPELYANSEEDADE